MKDIICNSCGKVLLKSGDCLTKDYVRVYKEWGYFSEKDGLCMEYYLCEQCQDLIASDFVVPVITHRITECM